MGSKYSDSHVENIERFRNIIQVCHTFGGVYNPSNPDLMLANMTLKLEAVELMEKEYGLAYAETKQPINERQVLIAKLVKRMRRVNNAVYCSGVSKETKRDVKAFVDKFTGDKVRKKKPKKEKREKKWVSNSHLGIASRMETLGFLLGLLRVEPLYNPNEADLKMAALDDASEKLQSLTEIINMVNENAASKRMARDRGLYEEEDGLVDVSLLCKKYVRALYGPRSEQARRVSGIKLKRFMKIGKI